jgi:hypothetical protein
LSAELALSQNAPLGDALAEVASVLPVAPRGLRRAHDAATRGDLPGALDALGYGRELSSLMVRAPSLARALSLRSTEVPELSLLLMPLAGLAPLLLASLLSPLIAAAVLERALVEFPSTTEVGPLPLQLALDLSWWLWHWLLPLLWLVIAAGTFVFWVAIAQPTFRARLFRRTSRALEDARRLSWSACLSAGGVDPTPALRLLSAHGRAGVARSRASRAEDFERLAEDALLEARRCAARSATGLRLGLGLLAVLGGATVALHITTRLALLTLAVGP